ncbi:MAG: CotY/CotZ family spore coat protein [Bacilli bacterium]
MCNNNDSNCIAEILTVICILQQNANCQDSCLDTCDKGFLGNPTTCMVCNTRPIMLYTGSGNGTPWAMPTTKNQDGDTSTVFRVEKVDNNCCTCRVLAENNSDDSSCMPYVATNSFFTMNLGCCCAIRCLQDTYIDCL